MVKTPGYTSAITPVDTRPREEEAMITSELPDELRGRITAMLERIEQYKGLILCTDRDLEELNYSRI